MHAHAPTQPCIIWGHRLSSLATSLKAGHCPVDFQVLGLWCKLRGTWWWLHKPISPRRDFSSYYSVEFSDMTGHVCTERPGSWAGLTLARRGRWWHRPLKGHPDQGSRSVLKNEHETAPQGSDLELMRLHPHYVTNPLGEKWLFLIDFKREGVGSPDQVSPSPPFSWQTKMKTDQLGRIWGTITV